MDADSKKMNLEELEVTKSSGNDATFNYTKQEEAKLIRKVDLNLLIILGTLYAFALIDRVNLSSAAIAGMNEDLHLTGTNRYSIITLIFFVPYVIVELPANMVIRKVSPRFCLGTIAVLWGAVMIGMGYCTNWAQMAGCRVLLGAFEGGFFPACAFLIQSWYIRKEVQIRYAYFYFISVLATGFSAILAYGLTQLEGAHGIRGWRWIFIVEGAITIGLGLLCYIFVQDFPDRKSRFLTEHECAFIRYRIEKDRGDSEADSLGIKNISQHFLDYKLWLYALLFMCSTTASYANGYFLPIILNGMGFNVRDSQLLTAPPVVFAVILGLFISYLSDRLWLRSPFIVLQACFVIIGILMIAYCDGHAARYAGCFINVAGAQGNVPSILAYSANNITSYSKRAASSALTISFGAIGGIYATTVYRDQDAPKYIPATWAIVAAQLFIIVATGILTGVFMRNNKKEKEGTLKEPIEGTPGFRYTL